MKEYLIKVPLTIEEVGSTALPQSSFVSIVARCPDDTALPEDVVRVLGYQLAESMRMFAEERSE